MIYTELLKFKVEGYNACPYAQTYGHWCNYIIDRWNDTFNTKEQVFQLGYVFLRSCLLSFEALLGASKS